MATLVTELRSRRALIDQLRRRFYRQRKRRGWSRRYVAGILETSESQIQNLEQARNRNHNEDFLIAVAELTDRWEEEARLHDEGEVICDAIKAQENFREALVTGGMLRAVSAAIEV